MGLCATLRNFTGVCECEAVQDLVYFLCDGAKEVYKAYTGIEMSTNSHVYHKSWSVIMKTLIQLFLTENVFHEPTCSVTRAFQGLDKHELEFKT